MIRHTLTCTMLLGAAMTTLAQTATDKPQQTLADPKRRQAIVGIIRQAKAHDAKAAELLESALKQ